MKKKNKQLEKEKQWYDGTGKEVLDLREHLNTRLATGLYSKIIIGCDSQCYRKNITFATVIILDTEGQGAQFVYNKERLKKTTFRSTHERLLKEVEYSIMLGLELLDIFEKYNTSISIHADVNPDENYLSNSIIKEVVGWIIGVGFECVVKPNSFGASCAADRFTN